ncbi:MAG: hypothetical protein KatS3mg008_0932 [Acidimicrobiales bacterium]|nr:MAG: hypothetical protein KatS3mg008_0932 [Acidimicrobiales bacterium]
MSSGRDTEARQPGSSTERAPSRKRKVFGAVAIVGALWFVGAEMGIVVGLAVLVYLAIGLRPRDLVAIGAVLIATVPAAMILTGLPSTETISLQWVRQQTLASNLAFAGFACLVIGIVLDTTPALWKGGAAAEHGKTRLEIAAERGADSPRVVADAAVTPTRTTRRPVLVGAAWMVPTLAVQAGGQLVFSIIASRIHSPDVFGLASGLWSAVIFVSFMSGMGLTIGIPIYGADLSRDGRGIYTWSLVYTIFTSLVGTVLYLDLVDSPGTAALREWSTWGGEALFFACVAGSSVAALADARLLADRRWTWVLARAASAVAVRLLLVVLPGPREEPVWLFSIGMLPPALSGVAALWVVRRISGVRFHLFPLPSTWFAALRYTSINYLATIAAQSPINFIPVIVQRHVEPAVNGQFFLAWSAATIVYVFPTTVGQVLLSEGPKDVAAQGKRAVEALLASVTVVVAATIVAFSADGVVLAIFGREYAETARLLPWLVAAQFPWAVTAIRITQARLWHDHLTVALTTYTIGLGILILALSLIPTHGTNGAVTAWTLGQLAGLLVVTHRRRRSRIEHRVTRSGT